MIWIQKRDLAVTLIVLLTFGTTINLYAKPRTKGRQQGGYEHA